MTTSADIDRAASAGAPRAPSFVSGLACKECGRAYEKAPLHVCEHCFGPLEVVYDYDAIARVISRAAIEKRPQSMWRYAELLPIDREPSVGAHTGGTPLRRATRLEKKLGLAELWIKNDAVSFPTLSFKDRVVSVALSKAREFGMDTVACASTGNLANAVAAGAASAGLKAYIFIPYDLERTKVLGTTVYGASVIGIRGTYDDTNRLCSEVAGKYGWGFVNVNLRPFYAEGSKSLAYEIAEQLGWRLPRQIVAPMASGSLLTKIVKAFAELEKLSLCEPQGVRVFGAQAAGCGPIAEAVLAGRDVIKPVKTPRTIAKSLAIGNPADGFYAARAIRDSRGGAALVTDDEIVAAMRLLAEHEGIFAETAGGVTMAGTLKLLEEGALRKDESLVVAITGNGLKTTDPLAEALPTPQVIGPSLREFEAMLSR
jgi:threonine synthase